MPNPASFRERPLTRPNQLFGILGLLVVVAAFIASSTLLIRRLPSGNAVTAGLKLEVYAVTFGFEFLFAGYAIRQLRRLGFSVGQIVNLPRSAKAWTADAALAAAFWLLWTLVAIGLIFLLKPGAANYTVLLPARRLETGVWIALSVAAGFCEELLFRGYAQKALELSSRARFAIVAQAVIFGLIHTYQGIKRVALITVLGMLFGLLAEWRRSLWPGMLVHMWIDISGVIFFRS